MAKIKTLVITYDRTFNLGDRNFAKLGATIEAELSPEDDAIQVGRALFTGAVAQVKAQALPLIANKRNEVERAFLALPEIVQNEVMERLYNGEPENDPDERAVDHFTYKP